MAKRRRRAPAQSNLRDVVASLISDRADPAELIELAYWSQEPHLLPAIRSLVGMSEETRAAICTYLSTMRDPTQITARLVEPSDLLLSAPECAGPEQPARSARSGKRALIN